MQTRAKVFLVDDHPLVRTGMTTEIEQTADLIVCGQADTRAAALAGIARTKPQLVTIDLHLRDSSGLDLLKDLRVQHPRLRTLVVTEWDDLPLARSALSAGAAGYLVKTEPSAALVPAIRTVLAGRPYFSADIATQLAADSHRPAAKTGVAAFSDRELEVFLRLAQGQAVGHIANECGLGLFTIYTYCNRMQAKLSLRCIAELRREAVHWLARRKPV